MEIARDIAKLGVRALVLERACGEPADPDPVDPRRQVIALFDEVRPSLFRYLRWMGSTAEEADDTIQETFLRLHAHLLAGGSTDNLRGWLFRVAGNLTGDDRKSGRRRFSEPLDPAASWPAPESNPEQAALDGESARMLALAVERLPEEQRRCLALRSEGFRYREIAAILGIGTSTVAYVLRRAVAALSKELP